MNPGKHTLAGTNTFLIGTGHKRILLDTGDGKQEYMPLLLQAMKKWGITSIQEILLTHWHHDHVGGIPDLQRQFGSLAISKHRVGNAARDGTYADIQDGQVYRTEGATLKAIFTPGHTDDHMCFWLEEEKAIFSGDCILGAGTSVFANLSTYMSSLRRLAVLQPTKIYPAHGPMIEDGADRIEGYIKHRMTREAQIVDTLKRSERPMSAMEIVKLLYTDTNPALFPAAATNVLLHLFKLKDEGKVACNDSAAVLGLATEGGVATAEQTNNWIWSIIRDAKL
jgi:glyoxylase-like metal-dependent hydrolase (beta-lactamase superfamily II)